MTWPQNSHSITPLCVLAAMIGDSRLNTNKEKEVVRCDGILEERADAVKIFCMLYKMFLRLIFLTMCLHVGTCTCMRVSSKARGIQFPWS